jgi:23S rRNA-/tRNA-specific pseudouridylate synthase
MGNGDFAALRSIPMLVLPLHDVIYEDDHMAIVNKPAGIVVYRQGSGLNGFLSVRAVLPWVGGTSSKHGTYFVLTYPASAHRLDKPTSWLLVVAKTKPALINLGQQFHDQIVQKTYTAIVNGIPE